MPGNTSGWKLQHASAFIGGQPEFAPGTLSKPAFDGAADERRYTPMDDRLARLNFATALTDI
jgi:hypothetical protein